MVEGYNRSIVGRDPRFDPYTYIVPEIVSKYMLSDMLQVGITMGQTYYWVGIDTLMYLVFDSAGGHGTDK